MDPNAVLARLLDGCRDGDAQAVYDACDDLAEWVDRGGFVPADPRKERSDDQDQDQASAPDELDVG